MAATPPTLINIRSEANAEWVPILRAREPRRMGQRIIFRFGLVFAFACRCNRHGIDYQASGVEAKAYAQRLERALLATPEQSQKLIALCPMSLGNEFLLFRREIVGGKSVTTCFDDFQVTAQEPAGIRVRYCTDRSAVAMTE